MSATEGNHGESQGHGPPTPAEPKTPMWLPALGAVLFLAVGLLWGLSTPPADPAGKTGAPAASADAGAAAAPH